MTGPVRVVVVEHRSPSRARLVQALEGDGDVTVVGECEDGDGAVAAIASLRPDVVAVSAAVGAPVTETIEAIMAFAPTPVLVVKRGCASVSDDCPEVAAGAVGVLAWPDDVAGDGAALRQRVRVLRGITVVRHPRARLRRPVPSAPPTVAPSRSLHVGPVVGMAASTGGPHTLATVLLGLGDIAAPVLVVQHIHADFVDGLVGWLAQASGRRTAIAADGVVPEAGVVYVAPGGRHLTVAADGRLRLRTEPPALHTPSANELFRSMALALGDRAVGVLLTGMGDDGAAGLLAIHRAGGATIVQDARSAAIDGMPRAARELGAAGVVAPLQGIAAAVRRAASERAA